MKIVHELPLNASVASLPKNAKVGDVRIDNSGPSTKVYKLVKFAKGTANLSGVAGDFACYLKSGIDTVPTVTLDVSDTNAVPAGVLVGTVTDGQYCWIQVGGLAVVNTLSSGSDGNACKAGGDKAVAVASAVTDAIAGQIIDASGKKILLACSL